MISLGTEAVLVSGVVDSDLLAILADVRVVSLSHLGLVLLLASVLGVSLLVSGDSVSGLVREGVRSVLSALVVGLDDGGLLVGRVGLVLVVLGLVVLLLVLSDRRGSNDRQKGAGHDQLQEKGLKHVRLLYDDDDPEAKDTHEFVHVSWIAELVVLVMNGQLDLMLSYPVECLFIRSIDAAIMSHIRLFNCDPQPNQPNSDGGYTLSVL